MARMVRSKKYKISLFVRTDRSFILKSMRGSKPSAQLRDESLQDGTAVGGPGCCWEQFDPSGGLGRGGARMGWGSVSQPSIPKSSVNFLTFSRSSVLTVGRVVDRERSMSDCKGGRETSHFCLTLVFLFSVSPSSRV